MSQDSDKWYHTLLDLRDGNVQRHNQGRYIAGSGRKYRQFKEMEALEKEIEMREQQRPIFKQITPVARALEMAKSEIKCKRKGNDSESTTGGKRQCKICGLEFIQIFER